MMMMVYNVSFFSSSLLTSWMAVRGGDECNCAANTERALVKRKKRIKKGSLKNTNISIVQRA